MIEHKNIFYVRDLNVIGGVETYINEILKKYHDYDIGVVYKQGHPDQIRRVRQYCPCYKHTNQKIKCERAIINWDTSIIPFIDEKAIIYQGIHADYDHEYYTTRGFKPIPNPRIDYYIAITEHIKDTYSKVTNVPQKKIIMSYNPLTLDKSEKPLVLISATRLSPEKGEKRMQKFAKAMDESGINYVWFIFTDSEKTIQSPNVVYREPTLDIGNWMDLADYLVQLSDTEGCSYSINEMMYRNKPCILTPLHYLDELGIKDGVNCYIIKPDCSNIDDVVKRIKKVPKFTFKKLEDKYDEILVKSKSHYTPKEVVKRLQCTSMIGFDLIQEEKHVNFNEIIEVDEYRADELLSCKGCFKEIE